MLRQRELENQTGAPVIEDHATPAESQMAAAAVFSADSVRKAVMAATLQKPYSLFPAVLGVLGLTAGVLFASVEAAAAGGVGLLIGLGGWIVDYFFRYDRHAHRLLEDYHAARRRHIAEQLQRLQDALSAMHFERGAAQLVKLQHKYDGLKAVLADKMSPGEITYSRYLGVAEQVYLNALDRLHDVVSLLRSVQAIDIGYIESRLAELAPDSADAEALRERRKLYAIVQQQAEELVGANEAAMTALDTTAVKLAGIRTRQGRARVDMESAMAELMRLADRASLYEVRS